MNSRLHISLKRVSNYFYLEPSSELPRCRVDKNILFHKELQRIMEELFDLFPLNKLKKSSSQH